MLGLGGISITEQFVTYLLKGDVLIRDSILGVFLRKFSIDCKKVTSNQSLFLDLRPIFNILYASDYIKSVFWTKGIAQGATRKKI